MRKLFFWSCLVFSVFAVSAGCSDEPTPPTDVGPDTQADTGGDEATDAGSDSGADATADTAGDSGGEAETGSGDTSGADASRDTRGDGEGDAEDGGASEDTGHRDAGPADGGADTSGVCASAGRGSGHCIRDSDCPRGALCMPNREVCRQTSVCLEAVGSRDERTPETCGLDVEIDGSCYELSTCAEPDAEIKSIGDACADDGTCPAGMDCVGCACMEVVRN